MITIPNGVPLIGYYAFGHCSSLTNIDIPNSVTSIDNGAFAGCDNLTIKFDGVKNEWGKISKDNGWDVDTGDYTVICTDGTLAKKESEK